MKKILILAMALVALVSIMASGSALASNASPASASEAALAVSTTINPVADAYVDSSAPSTNYGTSTQLRVDASPTVRSYLRFSVSGVSGAISQATLRIYANSSLSSGVTANRVADNTWGESTVNYGNAPAVGSALGTSSAVTSGTWVTLDVTSYVTGNGTFSFAITSANATALSLASREASNKPQLVITTATSATPTATSVPPTATSVPPTATSVLPTATPGGTGSTITVNPAADSYVDSSATSTNYGTSTQLRLDASPIVRSYLRFAVAGLNGAVSKATLRLYANSALSSGVTANRVADNTWGESTINYSNAPALGSAIATSAAVSAGTWIAIDVTSYVNGNGTLSFALTSTNATALSLASREAATKPELVVTTGSGTLPTATPTQIQPTATPTSVGPTPTKMPPTATPLPPTNTPPPSGGDPILLVTGDSRTGCNAGATATANLLAKYPSSTLVLFNGDATSTGAASEFTSCFNTTFGKYKAQLRPEPGNHEYMTSGASGYFGYYGAQAHSPGYYSFDVGTWHIVGLNSEIDISATSAQMTWLKNDLAAHPTQCSIAFWHEPRWSSGNHGNNTFVSSLWTTLYNANVELAFNGHDHDYERFAPMNPSGALDNARGIREFVVGTAGAPPYAFSSIQANSQARMTGQYGLVQLTLHPSSYDWKWIAGTGTFTDSGSGTCH